MKNVCRKGHTMKKRFFCWWFFLLFVLGFITVAAVDSKADYTRNPDLIPTDADLTLIGGRANTVVIRLLNLTPYNIVQDPSHITAMSFTNTDRKTHKSGMFAPIGWPGGSYALRGLSGNWSKVPATGNNIFTPDQTNTWVHPYNFVVTWDDQGGYVENSMMGWTIKNVYAAGLGPVTKDVPFRMWFTRVKPENALKGDLFPFISSFVIFGVDLIGVIIDPVNPIAWIDMFVATSEIAKQGFELSNSEETGGDKDVPCFLCCTRW